MLMSLAIVCGAIGLAVTGAAVYAVAAALQQRKQAADNGAKAPFAETGTAYLLRWTAWDYAVLAVFAAGMLFLLVDLLGVVRDRASFPDYRFGYMLCGFVFSLLGMLLMVVRLGLVLQLAGSSRAPAPQHEREPEQADRAE